MNAARVMPRPRLFDAIDAAQDAGIVWISAPAGSGKSCLLAGYLHGRAALGYQVDESDADPAAFFLGLAQASAATGNGPLLPVYDASFAARLRPFSRAFGAALVARHGASLVLALDDFHDAPAGSALAGVIVAMAGATPGLRILVASRLPPPASTARLQMHGTLVLLTWPDLRLTLDEARSLLPHSAGDERVALLHRLSDGWAAGLVLLSRCASPPQAGLPPDAPDRGLLADYLAREVIVHASDEQRRALVATALLPEFDEAEVAALLGTGDGAALLAELARMPFLVRRGEPTQRPRFSHHPLLREFLLARLADEFDAAAAAALRRRAAGLLLARGDLEPGLRLLHEHAGADELAQAIRHGAKAWIGEGRNASVEAWIARLPPAQRDADAWLGYWLGRAVMPRNPAAALPPLEHAAGRFRAAGDRRGLLLVCAAILDAVSYGYAELGRLGRWLDEAAALVPEMARWLGDDEKAEVMAALFAALVIHQRPHPLLAAWREVAIALSARSPNATLRAYVAGAAAMGHVWAGDYAAAAVLAPRLRQEVDSPAAGALARLTGWLVLAVLDGNMPKAEPDYRSVEEALRVAHETGVHVWDAELHGQEAVIALAAADTARAGKALDAMLHCLPAGASVHSAGYHCFCAWRSLLGGDAVAAARQADAALADARASASLPLRRHATVVAAQAALALGRFDAARERLAAIAEADATSPRGRFVRGLLEAELARREGRLDAACASLAAALALGREAGYTAFYGWLPDVMAELAALALRHGVEVAYVRSLVELRRLMPATPPLNIDAWPWPVRVRTLGSAAVEGIPALTRHGVRTPSKPVDLLFALVAFGAHDVAETTLADALWPDAEGDAAQGTLESTLHRLRKLFADADVVGLASGRLGLNPKRIWVDVWALDQLLDEGERAPRWPPERLDRVFDLYHGPFLAGHAAAWAEPLRARLRQRLRLVVSRHLLGLVDAGRAADALPRALRAAQAEPQDRHWAGLIDRIQAAAALPSSG